ncbi:MAG: NADH-quinone oxidoreductase subunit C [Armatimonadetes bacterium]|nr:NADH-quinone oxidoreductase subunit C [Armatimonadota bacterium]
MTRSEILKALGDKFPGVEIKEDDTNPEALIVPADNLVELASHLKDDPALSFKYNMVITAADWVEHVDVIYYFMSYEHGHTVALKVQLPNERMKVHTLAGVWRSANWFEREVYDLFGVIFEGHPDLRRIMMPADWDGHPLRKGYQHPNFVPLPGKDNPASKTGMGHHTI